MDESRSGRQDDTGAAGPSSGPLAGLRVLDFTAFLSGPYSTQMLADLGADVIKVESPGGDLSRSIAPHFVRDDSLYFHGTNRNKRSIVLDLKHPEAPVLVADLVARCDVVIENFRPGVLARLGVDGAELRTRHPRLIWCAISGFGQTGPYRSLPAYDMVVQAMSGSMSITGEPGRPSVRTGVPLADLAAGLHAVVGILAALHRREQTGLGETIDISMMDCLVSMLSYQATYFLKSGVVPQPQGRAHDSIPTYRTFTAGDGRDICITANTEAMWRALCTVLGCDDLVHDERFLTSGSRLKHQEELWGVLEPAFLARSAQEWATLLNAASVPAALVKDFDDVFRDPQVLHREMVLTLEDEGGDEVRVPGDPIKLQDSQRAGHRFPPRLGEDTDDVLAELLGLDNDVLAAWRADGLFGGSDSSAAQR